MNYLVPSIILLLTIVLYDHFNTISENLTNNSIPSCSCIYDIDSTLTTGESGKDIEIAIDSRASAESCIRAGCAIGVATGGTHCTEKDPEGCNITKYALGFNILNDDEVNNASKQIGLPIVTGKDWVIANWNKPMQCRHYLKKLANLHVVYLLMIIYYNHVDNVMHIHLIKVVLLLGDLQNLILKIQI